MSSGDAEFAELSYEEARDQLVEIVSRLETGGLSLEQSLTLWERGEALANRCEEWLTGAKTQLEQAIARHRSTGENGTAQVGSGEATA